MDLISLVQVDDRGEIMGYCSVDPEDIKFINQAGNSVNPITYIITSVNSFYVKGSHENTLEIVNEARKKS